jgi:conjugal transfer pilus assembly protein TraB
MKMPIPVLFRIKAPAQLPSGIRSKLTQGCFVIAEGSGNLSDERCHVRLLTIACVSKDGKAVIDQPIEGFVTDDDSKAGLKGKVVAKMGAALARSAAAGFIGGVGQAVQNSTNTYQTTPLGTTEILTSSDTTNIIRAGVGGGIAQAAEDLQKFYLDLSKQALPVVEIGGGRPVNLVISKGVNLEIKYQEVAK